MSECVLHIVLPHSTKYFLHIKTGFSVCPGIFLTLWSHFSEIGRFSSIFSIKSRRKWLSLFVKAPKFIQIEIYPNIFKYITSLIWSMHLIKLLHLSYEVCIKCITTLIWTMGKICINVHIYRYSKYTDMYLHIYSCPVTWISLN